MLHPPSRKEERLVRLIQHLDCLFQLSDMDTCIRLVPADVDLCRILGTAQLGKHIFRQIYQYRPRLTSACDVKGLFDDPSQIFSSADRHSVFCDTSCNAYDIYFLERVIFQSNVWPPVP